MQVAAAGLTVPAVIAARVCVGLGEGAALPVMNNLVATNVRPTKRATALGSCFSGFHTGMSGKYHFLASHVHHSIVMFKTPMACYIAYFALSPDLNSDE